MTYMQVAILNDRIIQKNYAKYIFIYHSVQGSHTVTPLLGNGAGAHGIGKISGVLGNWTLSLCMTFPLLD